MASSVDKSPMAIILAGLKSPKAKDQAMGKDHKEMMSESEADDEGGMDEGKIACAEEILAAIEAKDPEALATAFQSMMEICC